MSCFFVFLKCRYESGAGLHTEKAIVSEFGVIVSEYAHSADIKGQYRECPVPALDSIQIFFDFLNSCGEVLLLKFTLPNAEYLPASFFKAGGHLFVMAHIAFNFVLPEIGV